MSMSSPSSIASSSNGRLDLSLPERPSQEAMPPPEQRRPHSTSPQRGRYERTRRSSDPEPPRNREYSPSRRQYQPRPQRDRGSFSRSSGGTHDFSRTRNVEGLRVDTQVQSRAREGPATRSPHATGERGPRSPETPYSSASGARCQAVNHAQRRTARWKAGAGNKKGHNTNTQQRQQQYQNRKAWNRDRKPSDDTQSPTSLTLHQPQSSSERPSAFGQHADRIRHPDILISPILNPSSVSPADLDHAKDLVLDLLGWGVPPQYLLDRGVSPQLVHRIFTDLNLQLPQDFALPSNQGQPGAPIPV